MRLFGRAAVVQQVVFDEVTLQRVERERFFVLAHHGGVGEHHAQAPAEEVARRLAQEGGQLAQFQHEARLHLVGRQGINRGFLVQPVGRTPLAGIGQ